MEKYILTNVHEDVRADLSRLKQLQRNLLNWEAQLKMVFIEPKNQVHSDLEYFNLMKSHAERMVNKIVSALKIIELRIEGKVPTSLKQIGKKEESIKQTEIKPTHRETILAHNFLIEAKLADFKTSTQWETEGGAKRKQAFYTLDTNNKKKYRGPNQKELETAIKLLKEYPAAQKIAINKLDVLKNS